MLPIAMCAEALRRGAYLAAVENEGRVAPGAVEAVVQPCIGDGLFVVGILALGEQLAVIVVTHDAASTSQHIVRSQVSGCGSRIGCCRSGCGSA